MDKYYSMGWKKAAILAIALLILLDSAQAAKITLGSMPDVNDLTILPGQQNIFKASFFSIDPDPVTVTFTADYSSELDVEIVPKEITLRSTPTTSPVSGSEDGWFVLADGRTYVPTKEVLIYVRIPKTISTNRYQIKLRAEARAYEDERDDMVTQKIRQVRELLFTAYVPGPVVGSRPELYPDNSPEDDEARRQPGYQPSGDTIIQKVIRTPETPSGISDGFPSGGPSTGSGDTSGPREEPASGEIIKAPSGGEDSNTPSQSGGSGALTGMVIKSENSGSGWAIPVLVLLLFTPLLIYVIYWRWK